MSYYDTSINECVSFNNAEATTNYRGKYDYDPYGWVTSFGYGETSNIEIWGANIWTAAATEKIGAVGTYVTDPGTQLTIYVYTNVTAGNPTSGALSATKSYTGTNPGYFTVKLDSAVSITAGQRFSVVIRYFNTGSGSTKWLLPVEGKWSGYSDSANNNAGESYIKHLSGNTWVDWKTTTDSGSYYQSTTNDCIKAYVGGDCTPNAKKDLVGSYADGVWYRSSDSGAWTQLGSAATLLAVGDLDSDCIDDMIGIWPSQGGVWVKYSKTGTWALLSSTAHHITTGDMNGDGKPELLGTWDGQGVFWRDNTTGAWTQLASPANLITAGDIDGDGKDDVIGIWPSQGGVWTKSSLNGAWTQLSSTAADIASGDTNGDGRKELLATYDGQGVFYRNSLTGAWTLMSSPATQVTCGDLDGDGTDDLIGIWPSQSGVWVKYSKTGAWALLSSSATDIVSGRMRAFGASGTMDSMALMSPFGTFVTGPVKGPGSLDLSSQGPGGRHFVKKAGTNLVPLPSGESMIPLMAGPGEPGFRFEKQKNLRPGENIK